MLFCIFGFENFYQFSMIIGEFLKIQSVNAFNKMKNIITILFVLLIKITSSTAQNFQWGKRMGGTSWCQGNSIAVDGFGNVYTTGFFTGTVDFDPGVETYDLTGGGSFDIFIVKLAAGGNFVWAKRMGGTFECKGKSIAVDGTGNVYITGFFMGTVDFNPGAGISNLTSVGEQDIFIAKLDTEGNFVWAKSMGAASYDSGTSIALDGFGNVYTTGNFYQSVDFDPGLGTSNVTSVGWSDMFILKLDETGNFVWVKSVGGFFGSVHGNAIALDDSNNVFTTGYFQGSEPIDFDPGAGTSFFLIPGVNGNIFISKLDSAGNFVWAKSMGGLDHDEGKSITVDSYGNVYTIGTFKGTADFDPGTDTINLTSAGLEDIFISKFDALGNLNWVKSIGGPSYDFGFSIALDGSNNVFSTGYFVGTTDFDPGMGISNLTTAGGSGNVFILELDEEGAFGSAKNIGGGLTYGYSIVVNESDNVYTAGRFSGNVDFDPGVGTSILMSSGSSDAFVHKMSECVISDLSTSISGATIFANNGAASYQWLDCANNYSEIAGEAGQSFTAWDNGNYAVELTENGCLDTSDCVAITSVGLSENNFMNSLIAFPNPSNSDVRIYLGKSYDDVTLVARNQLGQEVFRKSYSESKELQLNLTGEAGMYFIELSTRDSRAILKVIKE